MKQAEMAIIRSKNLASNLIEYISDNLLQANLIWECLRETLLDVKSLKNSWQETSKKKVEDINLLSKGNLESYWHFLAKPHSQRIVLRCLSIATNQLLPTLHDAVSTWYMHMKPIHSPQIKPMMDICGLRGRMENQLATQS